MPISSSPSINFNTLSFLSNSETDSGTTNSVYRFLSTEVCLSWFLNGFAEQFSAFICIVFFLIISILTVFSVLFADGSIATTNISSLTGLNLSMVNFPLTTSTKFSV